MSKPYETGESKERSLHPVMIMIGVIATAATALLAARLAWEMTSLTWQEGPQMVGFSLIHGYGAFLIFAPLLLVLWIAVTFFIFVTWLLRRKRILRGSWISFGAAIVVLGFLSLPQSFWNWVFVGQLAHSSKSGDLLVTAAGDGELHVVQGMLGRGVSINALNYENDTPLHTAAALGRTRMVEFLLQNGANINAANLYGDSPLQEAIDLHHEDTASVLRAAGAQAIQGTPEQRNKASQTIVKRAIEKQNGWH